MGSLALGQTSLTTYLQLNSFNQISLISFDADTVEHIYITVVVPDQNVCVFLLDGFFTSKKQCETLIQVCRQSGPLLLHLTKEILFTEVSKALSCRPVPKEHLLPSCDETFFSSLSFIVPAAIY